MNQFLTDLRNRAIFIDGIIQFIFLILLGYLIQDNLGWGPLVLYLVAVAILLPFLRNILAFPFGTAALFLGLWFVDNANNLDTFSDIAPYYLPFSILLHGLNLGLAYRETKQIENITVAPTVIAEDQAKSSKKPIIAVCLLDRSPSVKPSKSREVQLYNNGEGVTGMRSIPVSGEFSGCLVA